MVRRYNMPREPCAYALTRAVECREKILKKIQTEYHVVETDSRVAFAALSRLNIFTRLIIRFKGYILCKYTLANVFEK